MEHMEMVEKLHEKAGVSMTDARIALEQSGWDMLDALVYLEKEGKIPPLTSSMTTVESNTGYEDVKATADRASRKSKDREAFNQRKRSFIDKCADLLRKSMTHAFIVRRNGKELLALPVLIAAIITVALFRFVLAAALIGLFFDCTYAVEKRD